MSPRKRWTVTNPKMEQLIITTCWNKSHVDIVSVFLNLSLFWTHPSFSCANGTWQNACMGRASDWVASDHGSIVRSLGAGRSWPSVCKPKEHRPPDHVWRQGTETTRNKTVDKGQLCYVIFAKPSENTNKKKKKKSKKSPMLPLSDDNLC